MNKQEDGNMRGRLGKCEGLFPSLHVKSYEKTEKGKITKSNVLIQIQNKPSGYQ